MVSLWPYTSFSVGWEGVRSALLAGDVSSAWSIRSFSAEVSLVRAFIDAGAPVPQAGLRLGRGAAQLRHVPCGGPMVGKLRSDLGSGDGQSVHLFKNASVAGVMLPSAQAWLCSFGIGWYFLVWSHSLSLS